MDIDKKQIKVVAMDLDGTLSQHKQPLPAANRAALGRLSEKYTLLMVGAGDASRIFRQMEGYPVNIIGNYGLQYAKYNKNTGNLDVVREMIFPFDKASVERAVWAFRKKHGFEKFSGESVEYHASGCITIPLLGTKAELKDKLAFDPDRKKRRAVYGEVTAAFPDYNVFVGGSSSFDMAPKPYNKYHALDEYCRERGLEHENVVYIGDDYGLGGNDECVCLSDFPYLKIDCYRDFPRVVSDLL